MTAEEKLRKLRELELEQGAMYIASEHIDLIANLVVERLRNELSSNKQ